MQFEQIIITKAVISSVIIAFSIDEPIGIIEFKSDRWSRELQVDCHNPARQNYFLKVIK